MGFFTDPEPQKFVERGVPQELHRDQWRRVLISVPDNSPDLAPYVGASRLGEAVTDCYGLKDWQIARMVVGFGCRPDLQLRAIALHEADQDAANRAAREVGDEALFAGGGKDAANTGTAIAAIVEKHLYGEPVADAGPWQGTVDAVLRVLGDFRVHTAERFIVNDELGAVGAYDYLLSPLGWMQAPDGSWLGPDDCLIADLKTAQQAKYFNVKFEAQMATYVDGEHYRVTDPETGAGERYGWPDGEPHPRWALILHAPARGDVAQLRWVDVEAGRRSARRAVEQRRELAASKKRFPVASAPQAEAPAEALTDWQVRKAIHACRSLEGLRDLCVAHQAAGQAWPAEVVEWAKAYAVRQGWLEAEVSA